MSLNNIGNMVRGEPVLFLFFFGGGGGGLGGYDRLGFAAGRGPCLGL